MCSFLNIRVHYWPVITSVWFVITFITSYVISISNRHVYYFFPYISDTGAIPPESCVFGQMLNIGAVFMAITMYLRHRQVEFAYRTPTLRGISTKWNTSAKWLGIIACLGMSFVANFQETSFGLMHFFGAIMAFGLGSFYFIIQVRLTYTMYKKEMVRFYSINKQTLYFRTFLCFWMLPLFFSNVVLSNISMAQFDGEHIYYWTPQNKGYVLHLVATITEWIMALFMMFFVLTFTNEFRSLDVKGFEIASRIRPQN